MFIIKTENDARASAISMDHRITVEQKRLEKLRKIASQAGWNI